MEDIKITATDEEATLGDLNKKIEHLARIQGEDLPGVTETEYY